MSFFLSDLIFCSLEEALKKNNRKEKKTYFCSITDAKLLFIDIIFFYKDSVPR